MGVLPRTSRYDDVCSCKHFGEPAIYRTAYALEELGRWGEVAGLALLRAALDWLREARFGYYDAIFLGTLAQGMAAAAQTAEVRTVIDEALERCDRSEGRWCLAELLRIKASLLRLDGSATAVKAAEDHYLQALEWARRQEALSWELRAATSVAELWHGRGKTADAHQLLSSVYNRRLRAADLNTGRADQRAPHDSNALIARRADQSEKAGVVLMGLDAAPCRLGRAKFPQD